MDSSSHHFHFPPIFDLGFTHSGSSIELPQTNQYVFGSNPPTVNGIIPALSQDTREQEHRQDQRTSDQLMNNLTFSIEDLLSKITKVKEEYDCISSSTSPRQQSQQQKSNISTSTQSFPVNILPGNQQYLEEGAPIRKTSSQRDVGVEGLQGRNAKVYLNLTEEGERKKQMKKSLLEMRKELQCLELAKSFLEKQQNKKSIVIEDELQKNNKSFNTQTPTLGKISSLFRGGRIKEVAASMIMDPQVIHKHSESPLNAENTEKQTEFKITINNKSLRTESPIILSNLRIQDFQLGKELGCGKFGDVYQAMHKETCSVYAIKKIFKSTLLEYNMIEQFTRELKIHYSLNHPNIIKLYAHFHDDYHIFLLMQYMQGGALKHGKRYEEQFTSKVIEQSLRGVEYMHNRSIAHRDLKLQNVVLSFGDTAKLCDFGWSRIFDTQMKKTFCGTLDYISPEMKDKGEYSLKIDIWALGILCYEMLCGFGPLEKELGQLRRYGNFMAKNVNWNIKYPQFISTTSESFLRNLLRENPNERATLQFALRHKFIRFYNEVRFSLSQEKRYQEFFLLLNE